MGEQRLFELVIAGGVIWLIASFHWLRIITCGLLLAAWAAAAIGAPLYVALIRFGEGAVFSGIVVLALGGLLGFFWVLGAKAAYDWVQLQRRFNELWRPWNAR